MRSFETVLPLNGRSLRLLAGGTVLILLLPVVASGLAYSEPEATGETDVRNVTFVSTQGGATSATGGKAGVYAIDTETRERIWSHTDFHTNYFDVDPIGTDRVLFVAQTTADVYSYEAILMNWREDTVLDQFPVPRDTHDLDRLAPDRYVVADKENHRVYVYNTTTGEITWQFEFANHFGSDAGEGGVGGDYTHLNDVDAVDNDSAFLVSPRNFDRVALIDRENRSVEWVLGEEDNYEILYEQHNPVLLEESPPTVLVADSENDRVVEYRREDGGWERVWAYHGALEWPRDADRLPNGNTLIADSHGFRILEVTPSREVVWQFPGLNNPYDVERVEHGDEPTGPPMTEYADQFAAVEPRSPSYSYLSRVQRAYEELYFLGSWVLPLWVGKLEFGFLASASFVALGWAGTELLYMIPERLLGWLRRPAALMRGVTSVAAAVGTVLGVGLVFSVAARGGYTGFSVASGTLLVLVATLVLPLPRTTLERLFGSVPVRLVAAGELGLVLVGWLVAAGVGYAGVRSDPALEAAYLALAVAVGLVATHRLVQFLEEHGEL